jgi:hypothetical protein
VIRRGSPFPDSAESGFLLPLGIGQERALESDDWPEGCGMTPIDFRKKKALEIQDPLNKLSSLDGTNYSSDENKDRLFELIRPRSKIGCYSK